MKDRELKKLEKSKEKREMPKVGNPLKSSILDTIRCIKGKWLRDVNPRAALSKFRRHLSEHGISIAVCNGVYGFAFFTERA